MYITNLIENETLTIGAVKIVIVDVEGGKVKIGVEAPGVKIVKNK